jgi:type II secretory pathway pseudopilin PulG
MTEKRMLLITSGILCVVGLVAFFTGWTKTQAHLVQGGGAVVAASLVAMTASIGLTSWADERRKVRVEKQQAVYTDLVQQLVSRFRGESYDPQRESALRAQVSTWGSRAVVTALGRWHEAYDEVIPITSQGTVTLSEEAARRMRVATAELITAVRREIDPEDSTQAGEIADALFNQPGRYVHLPQVGGS